MTSLNKTNQSQSELDNIQSVIVTNSSGDNSKSPRPVTSSHQSQSHSHISPHDTQNQGPSQTQHHSDGHNHLQVHFNQGFDQSSHAYDEDDGLDDEDRQSEEGSEGEPGFHDMEYWLQRCSICFDSRLEFCLEICRDQFCRDCFQRYVKEVVSNSWGLNVTKIKCPVCQDTIAQSEWIKYVDQATLVQYNQYNQPYRSFSRFCNECDHESVISQVNHSVVGMPVWELRPIFENLQLELKSLLALAGLNANELGLSSRQPSKSKAKQHTHVSCQDERAHEIVQRFMDDYKSFCGEPQGPRPSLPSKAQSYLSNLAFRTLGGPFIAQPSSSVPSSSASHSSSTSSQPHTPQSTSSPSSLPQITIIQSMSTQQSSSDSTLNITPQKKNHRPKVNGILEIYKSLMIPLLSLLEIPSDVKTESKDPSHRSYIGHTVPKNNVGEDDGMTEESESASSAMELESDLETKSSKRKGIPTCNPSKSKRTRPSRSSIVTRAEKKRQIEVKRALSLFSKHLSSIETRPEQWKELQFLHVRWLRWEWW
ncbi:hypothetical protein BGZ76_011611 [Entomortierella beljakovae]|nr:hypothetical protein BGZ76_011611 [Entomortierella beljakovae]